MFPALLLNYYGQGALRCSIRASAPTLLRLFPAWTLVPMVILATAATVIASQALISGAFCYPQAVQLGYLPRLKIVHTSKSVEGQIYMPFVTIALALA